MQSLRDGVGRGIHPRVHRVVGQPERREPGGDRERIAAQGAGLVHGSERGEQVEDPRRTAEAGERHAAADDLAERHEVGHPRLAGGLLEAPPAGGTHPEAGQDLIEDEQRAVGVRLVDEEAVEARLGGQHAGVRPGRLGDDRRDPPGMRGERGAHGVTVVVRQHQGEPGDRRGHPGGTRQSEGRDARAGLGEQAIGVPVVVAGELDDEVAPGGAAREPDRGHGGLGAGRDEPELLDHRRARRRRAGR